MNDKNRKMAVTAAVSLLWWIVSFFWEPLVFDTSQRSSVLPRYILVRVLCLGAMILAVTWFYSLVRGILKNEKNLALRSTLYALPVWAAALGIVILRKVELGEEEKDIIAAATRYDTMNAVFTYITSYVEMIAMMMVPSIRSPLILKILVMGLDAGYAAARMTEIYGTVLPGLLTCAAFLLPPALRSSCSVHRCPMYGMLYFFLAAKLFCDWKQGKKADRKTVVIVSFVLAVLTWWRTEGIYFLLLGPVLLHLTYRIRPGKRVTVRVMSAFLATQLLVWLPKTAAPELTIENYGKHQLTPFYNYVFTGMLCSGLDREKYAEELETVEEYLHIDFIDILYAQYGEHIYDEGYATYHSNYAVANRNATEEILNSYEAAVRHLIMKEPLLFIRSQIRAFSHISFHYDSPCLSSVFGNLWVVVLLLLLLLIRSALKKQWTVFFLTLCPVCHGCISTVFLPAAYFKYYYPEYLFVWLFLGFAASALLSRNGFNRKLPGNNKLKQS